MTTDFVGKALAQQADAPANGHIPLTPTQIRGLMRGTLTLDTLKRDPTAEPIAQPRITLVKASSVRMDRPYWAWDLRIPIGGTTLMPGREGLGKTALVCWLMARLTRGQLHGKWFGAPAEVVYIGMEDDRKSVLTPRLVAAGADLDQVHFVDMPEGMTFSVGVDTPDLIDALKGRNVAMVVLDPLDGHLTDTDTHRKAEVQQNVAKLAILAQELRCGALGLAHLNKGEVRDLLARVVGSVGFTTSVRSVIGVGEHPDNPEERVCVCAKANMTNKAEVPALRFKVEKGFVDHPDGGDPIDTGKVVILGEEMGIDPNTVIDSGSPAERAAVDIAVDWLNDILGDGPQPSVDIKKWAKAADIHERTLQRARVKAGVKVTRNENEQGRPSVWELSSRSVAPGYVPPDSCQTPLAHKARKPDQGEQPESTGYVPTSGVGTKPHHFGDCECGQPLITRTDHETGICVFCRDAQSAQERLL